MPWKPLSVSPTKNQGTQTNKIWRVYAAKSLGFWSRIDLNLHGRICSKTKDLGYLVLFPYSRFRVKTLHQRNLLQVMAFTNYKLKDFFKRFFSNSSEFFTTSVERIFLKRKLGSLLYHSSLVALQLPPGSPDLHPSQTRPTKSPVKDPAKHQAMLPAK